MRLIKTKPAGAFPVAARSRDGEQYEAYHPRLAAIRHLRELLADGRVGVDQYDKTIVIVDASEHERVWTARSLDLCGLILGSTLNWSGTRGARFRAILEADVRQELGLDTTAVVIEEPLASRRLDAGLAEAAALTAALDMLENPRTPVLRAVAGAREAQLRMLEQGRS